MAGLRLFLALAFISPVIAMGDATWGSGAAFAQGVIRNIEVVGSRRVEPETVRSYLQFNVGDGYSAAKVDASIKALFATAFEIDGSWLIKAASRRQKWIDQAQSLNLYLALPSGKKLDEIYKLAWLRGLKTTYYLRTLGASQAEKAGGRDDAVTTEEPKFCSIDNPECEACQ